MSSSREPMVPTATTRRATPSRRARRCVLLAGFVLGTLAVLFPARPASAHAILIGSDPANGATLAQAPRTARLWFSEDIAAEFRSIRLVASNGTPVAGTHVVPDAANHRALTLEMPPLPPGTYGMVWQVLATADGHSTSGAVVFAVGRGSAGAVITTGETGTGTRWFDVVLRWLRVSLLAGLIGGLAVAGLILRRAPAGVVDEPLLAMRVQWARGRILAFAAACAGLGAVVSVVDLVAQAYRTAPAAAGATPTVIVYRLLTATRWGQLWLAREGVLLALTVIAVALWRRPHWRGGPAWAAIGVLILAAAAVEAIGSHAAGLDSARTAAIAADAVHVLTACLWLGAVAALALIVWPRAAGGTAVIRAVRGRFTPLAALSVAIVAVTGLYSAGREVDTPAALVTTPYGRTLLIKSGLLLAVGGIGLVNSGRLHRGSVRGAGRASPSRRLLALEAGVGAVLLLAVGVLAETSPARATTAPVSTPAVARTLSGSRADLIVTVTVTPNRPGINGFTVLVASSRRPPPAPIDGVALNLTADGITSPVPAQQIKAGSYFGTTTVDAAGPVRLTAMVQRAGTYVDVSVDWSVPAGAPPEAAPPHRLAPIVNALALAVLGTVLSIGCVWAVATRRNRRDRAVVGGPRRDDGGAATDAADAHRAQIDDKVDETAVEGSLR
jgi:copper transport protein